MAIRRNLTTLSDADRDAYVRAVVALKAQGRYDPYVQLHATSMLFNPMQAHSSPMFLPWHRQFLKMFEADLQTILGASYALPYWDWAADQALPDPKNGVVWDDDFMGGQGDPVTTGPFQAGQWALWNGGGWLVRTFGVGVTTLPTAGDVNGALGVPVYDSPPWGAVIIPMPGTNYQSFRDQLEGWLSQPGQPYVPQLHNRVHVWIGGSMAEVSTAPNDPVFFLHHANVDRIWRQWQRRYPLSPYLPAAGVPWLSATNLMWPWNAAPYTATPSSVLSTIQLGYIYDTDIQRSVPFGGPHGNPFDDSNSLHTIPAVVTSVTATWNSVITSLTLTYANDLPTTDGTPVKDNSFTYPIPAGQTIQAVNVFTNKSNDKTGVVRITLEVSGQLVNPEFGPPGSSTYQRFAVPDGMYFAGFCGRESNRIYSLGIVTFPSQ